VVRVADGKLLVQAEGFVGDDEQTWAKRPMFARRAMAQTRAISRACRSAFAFVVTLMDAGLETTPAEEMDAAVAEPVRVRPKFPEPAATVESPDEPKRATSEDMQQTRHAVQVAKTEERLRKIRGTVEKRFLDEGFYTDAQADELLALIDGKLDFLTGEVAS